MNENELDRRNPGTNRARESARPDARHRAGGKLARDNAFSSAIDRAERIDRWAGKAKFYSAAGARKTRRPASRSFHIRASASRLRAPFRYQARSKRSCTGNRRAGAAAIRTAPSRSIVPARIHNIFDTESRRGARSRTNREPSNRQAGRESKNNTTPAAGPASPPRLRRE